MDSQKTENAVTNETEALKECIKNIPDFDNFQIDTLIKKIINDERSYDTSKITSAYQFAENAHKGQKRSSGQEYITHPIAVAYSLVELGMDTDTICAALLHDVIEDTSATFNEIQKRFGHDVALLVDGVTKLGKIPYLNRKEQSAENIRKLLFAMFKDIRVIIIKLCDRLHNIRTLKYCSREKQKRIAYETLQVYAAIAHRLGIKTIKDELEDLSFRYLDPYAYLEIEKMLENKKEEREAFIETIKERISENLKQSDMLSEPPFVDGRVKSIYGIYKKAYGKGKNIDEIYDKYAVRIIVSKKSECFSVFGLIHDMFTPIPGRFKDYISNPKENMYQSLHTTVLGKEGIPFEVQIRTWDMHETAEYGIAAHWKYKEGVYGKDKMEERLAWIRKLLETQNTFDDTEELLDAIKGDLAPDTIVVITPKGDSITLPDGATVIDFAYKIHTDIGHRMISAKVDGKLVPFDYKLSTGEVCEIIISKDKNKAPNRAWINIVFTAEARQKIRMWFKRERREENIKEGKQSLENEFRRNKINLPEEKYSEFLAEDFKRHNCENLDDFYASIGYGGISLIKIIPRLKEKYQELYKEEISVAPLLKSKPSSKGSVILDNINSVERKFAQCCNPLPGDDIVGYITRGHGISVHTTKCTNYLAVLKRNIPEELARWCDIQWQDDCDTQLQTSFMVIAAERVGLVHDITKVLTEARVFMVHSSSRTLKNGSAFFESTIVISSTEQLKNLFEKLRRIKGVISVDRVTV